jgi:hypothetical protein
MRQVLKGQITAGEDELGSAGAARVVGQHLIDLVGDGKHADHPSILRPGIRFAITRSVNAR